MLDHLLSHIVVGASKKDIFWRILCEIFLVGSLSFITSEAFIHKYLVIGSIYIDISIFFGLIIIIILMALILVNNLYRKLHMKNTNS